MEDDSDGEFCDQASTAFGFEEIVEESNLPQFPYNCICSVDIMDGTKLEHHLGTGFLIGAHLVMTCAHVIFNITEMCTYKKVCVNFPSGQAFSGDKSIQV